jgi:hypothetical protein
MDLENLIPTLQVAIGPVILISGVGLLLLSMTNRLGRVIDRTRQLTEAQRAGGESDRARLKGQLDILWRRARLVRASIVCASSGALLVIFLFAATLLQWQLAIVIVVLFGSCMAAIIAALVYFIRDINLSLHALQLEINFESRK